MRAGGASFEAPPVLCSGMMEHLLMSWGVLISQFQVVTRSSGDRVLVPGQSPSQTL